MVGNIKMDVKEIRWEGMDWTHLAHDRGQWLAFLGLVMNLGVTKYSVVTYYVRMRS